MNLSSQALPTESRVILAYEVLGHRAVEDPDLPHPVQLQLLLGLLVVAEICGLCDHYSVLLGSRHTHPDLTSSSWNLMLKDVVLTSIS